MLTLTGEHFYLLRSAGLQACALQIEAREAYPAATIRCERVAQASRLTWQAQGLEAALLTSSTTSF